MVGRAMRRRHAKEVEKVGPLITCLWERLGLGFLYEMRVAGSIHKYSMRTVSPNTGETEGKREVDSAGDRPHGEDDEGNDELNKKNKDNFLLNNSLDARRRARDRSEVMGDTAMIENKQLR